MWEIKGRLEGIASKSVNRRRYCQALEKWTIKQPLKCQDRFENNENYPKIKYKGHSPGSYDQTARIHANIQRNMESLIYDTAERVGHFALIIKTHGPCNKA